MRKLLQYRMLSCLMNIACISVFGMDGPSDFNTPGIQQKEIKKKALHSIYCSSGHYQENESVENLENYNQQIIKLCQSPYQFFAEIQEARNLERFPFNPYLLFLKVCTCKKMDTGLRIILENSAIDLLKQSFLFGRSSYYCQRWSGWCLSRIGISRQTCASRLQKTYISVD